MQAVLFDASAVDAGAKVPMVLGERPAPALGPGEARIRIEACGICGSDLHLMHHRAMAPGHTPGHEIVGRIEALGEPSHDWRETPAGVEPGARVAVEPMVSCGTCRECLAGRDSICRESRLFGVQLPGGMASEIAVPLHRLYPIDESLTPAVAAMAEPMAVSVHALARARLARGERVLILGSGTVGLVTLLAARALGAAEVWMTARYPQQAKVARALGAHEVLSEEEASAAGLGKIGLETAFDLVVETVGGAADTLACGAAAARPGGRICVLGLFFGSPPIEPFSMLTKELELCWSNCYHRAASFGASDFAVATRLVEEQRDALSQLATHQVPLADAARGFELAADKRSGAIKVTLTM